MDTASDWPSKTLGELIRLQKGVSYKGEYLDKPGPKLLGLGTVVPGGGIKLDEARTYSGPIRDIQRIVPGELLVALTDITQEGRVLGTPALVPTDGNDGFAVTHHVARVIVTSPKELDTRFLFYLLQGQDFKDYVRGFATGTTVRSVSIPDVLSYKAALPPLPEQRAIARVLGSLDEKIELNRHLNQTLEEVCRALFKFWFVDFGPARAKAEGRWTKGESLPGTPADMWDLWPSEFEESEIGEIPTGWRFVTLNELCQVPIRSGVYIPKQDRGEGAKLVNMGELFGNPRLFDIEMERVPLTGDQYARFGIEQDDVLFARRSMVGTGASQCSIVSEIVERTTFESSIIRVRPKADAVVSEYLHQFFWSDIGLQLLDSIGRHGPIAGITGSDLGRLRIPVPPIVIQKPFANLAHTLAARGASSLHESGALSAARDSLLPQFLSAEIRLGVDA